MRRRAFRHRRAIAVAGALLLHVLFIMALLPPSPDGLSNGGSGGMASGGGTGVTYAAVDLYAVQPAPAVTAVKTPTDPAADALDRPAETVKPPSDAIAASATGTPKSTQPDTAPPSPATDAASHAQAAAAIGGVGQAGTTSGTGDDLWAAIAPCWNRIAGKDSLAVALKVTFAGNGGLAKPPVIERADGAAITPQSLQSEAKAITALAQCGAYPMAASRQGVDIHFPKPD